MTNIGDIQGFLSFWFSQDSGLGLQSRCYGPPVRKGYYQVIIHAHTLHDDAAALMEFYAIRRHGSFPMLLDATNLHSNAAGKTYFSYVGPCILFEDDQMMSRIAVLANGKTHDFQMAYYELPISYPVPFLS